MRIVYSQGAQRDFQEGLQWYRKRSDKAAEGFITSMEQTLERITAHPERFRLVTENIRQAHFKRYPYSLIFRDLPDLIKVYAVAHDKRRPGYWQHRTF
jgi:plasmid stabilization system protein ParE